MTATHAAQEGAALGLVDRTHDTPEFRELTVEGRLPDWLTGSLLRNGPGAWNVGSDRMAHWFDGHAMLHHFTFTGGRVHYMSRFLDTEARRADLARGGVAAPQFATDPCRSIFKRVQSLFSTDALFDNANVSVHKLGDQLLAMTETPMPIEFDRATLHRIGQAYRAPGTLTTAHPHHERGTGALLNYAASLGARSSYRMFRVAPGTAQVEQLAEVPVREPAYMHSFGITERFFVLSEFPLVVNPLRLALSSRPFIANYRWRPERGTRYTVIDRRDGAVRAQLTGPACFGFHHINAYDDGDDVVVDMCVADDASFVQELYLDRIIGRLQDPSQTMTGYPKPVRSRLHLDRAEVTTRPLSSEYLELPTVNVRRARERPYSHLWGVGSDGTWSDRILALDVTTGATRTWCEPGTYPGEAVFVERPDAQAENDGVLLTIVLDAHRAGSALVVLDAATLETLARADVGHPVPYGFHGMHTST